MLDIDMLIKLAPASVATALASMVLPVPGGPKSNIPLHGWGKQMIRTTIAHRYESEKKHYIKCNKKIPLGNIQHPNFIAIPLFRFNSRIQDKKHTDE